MRTAALAATVALLASSAAAQDPVSALPESDITNPGWSRALSPPDYPEQALRAGISDARVVLRCRALPTGELADCRVIEETPPGVGFAEAALSTTASARVSPRSMQDAGPNPSVRFTIRFKLAD